MKKNIQNSEHYIWGESCDGWHLVQDRDLSIIMESMPPNTEERVHFHNLSQQFFFVLKGEAVFDLSGKTFRIGEGEGFHIPPKTKHKIRNVLDRSLEFLLISQPSTHHDRIEEPFKDCP